LEEDQSVSVDNGTDFAVFLVQYSDLAYRRKNRDLATRWLNEGIERLQDILRETPDNKEALYQLRVATFQYWLQNNHSLPSDQSLTEYADVGALEGAVSCKDVSLAARLAWLQGDRSSASDYTEYLLGKGFYDSGFTRFCREHGLCGE
jgi:predicted metal-dependent hydrolase